MEHNSRPPYSRDRGGPQQRRYPVKPKKPALDPSERLIIGLQPVREALRVHGASLHRVIVEQSESPTLEALARFATERGAKLERATRADLDRYAERHQGVVAFAAPLAMHAFEPGDLGPTALVLALDELEDPQNFGAILRSAVALGADCILWPENHSAPLSPATFRASAGAVEHAKLCRVPSLTSALDAAREAGIQVIGLDMGGEQELGALDLKGPVLLVVGAEGKGLRKPVKQRCTSLARLPMKGPIGSLNASVAAALSLYEILRQRA